MFRLKYANFSSGGNFFLAFSSTIIEVDFHFKMSSPEIRCQMLMTVSFKTKFFFANTAFRLHYVYVRY